MATANAATNYLEEKVLKYIFDNNSGTFSSPGASLYVGLATAITDAEAGTVTEATYQNYSRQQVDGTSSGWTIATGGGTCTASNAANIEYSASGSSPTNQTITHCFIADASTSGNILFVGALDANKTIGNLDIFRINAGNLSIELK
tara:strand:- start:356 stop:793 length:438 start_codon:yes stop_codon:yes gene_type:complete